MKNLFRTLFIMLMVIFTFNNSFARNKSLGLGVIIGEPTGLSAKLWKSNSTAYDAGLAWSLGEKGNLHLHADHLWHNSGLIPNQRIPLYYGLGARVNLGDKVGFGIRGVMGINYFLKDIPLETFFELVPVFDLMPGTGFGLNAGLGLRFYF